jgi:hypothetical protein
MALEPQLLPPVTRQQSNCNIFDELETLPYFILIYYMIITIWENEWDQCHVQCVPGSIPRKHSGKLYAQEVSYVKDIVPYKKHRYQYSTCQANDGSLLGPCVLAIGGILPCITTHIHTDTLIHVGTGTWMWSGHTIIYSLMNKVLSC